MGKHHSKSYWAKYYALKSNSNLEFDNPDQKTYNALTDVSSYIKRGKCVVRQGKTWREMGGSPFIPAGSNEQTHGKKKCHDGRIVSGKILSFNGEYLKLAGK